MSAVWGFMGCCNFCCASVKARTRYRWTSSFFDHGFSLSFCLLSFFYFFFFSFIYLISSSKRLRLSKMLPPFGRGMDRSPVFSFTSSFCWTASIGTRSRLPLSFEFSRMLPSFNANRLRFGKVFTIFYTGCTSAFLNLCILLTFPVEMYFSVKELPRLQSWLLEDCNSSC